MVKPGQTFIYRFRAKQMGTFWFHSHQQASEQVTKGLFGSLIVEAKKEVHPYDVDVTAINHRWNLGNRSIMALRYFDQEQRKNHRPICQACCLITAINQPIHLHIWKRVPKRRHLIQLTMARVFKIH